MEKGKKQSNFIMQAGILAAAGILVRVIGILYRSPLTAIIGDEGNGYYSFAYNIYANILLISSYSIPSAISKVIAQKLAHHEYRNAQRIFRCALLYVIVVGGAASLFAYFAAPFLVVENAVGVLRVFAPTIFLSGLLGCLRGYFQARRNMVPTSVSQILEQIMNAIVSVGAAYLFIRWLAKGSGDTLKAIYGASGSAVGTGSGVLIALIFMLVIYLRYRPQEERLIREEDSGALDEYAVILKNILLVVTPFILSTFIYNCSTAVDQTIFSDVIMKTAGIRQEEAATLYGVFSGKAVVLRNLPVAIASAMSAAIIPTISGTWSLGQKEDSCKKVSAAMKATMMIAIPGSFGLLFLARPIVWLLFPQKSSIDLASHLLMALAFTVIFYCISTISNGVLQAIGRVNRPVIHAAIALVVQAGILYLLLGFSNMGLYALVVAEFVYSVLMCVLNGVSMRKDMEYKQEVGRTFLRPAIAALLMGIVARLIYEGVYALLKSNALSLCIALVCALISYFVLVFLTGAVTAEEVKTFPKGNMILAAARKLHLLKH